MEKKYLYNGKIELTEEELYKMYENEMFEKWADEMVKHGILIRKKGDKKGNGIGNFKPGPAIKKYIDAALKDKKEEAQIDGN